MPSSVRSYSSARSPFTRHSTRVPVAHPRPTLTSAQLHNRKPGPVPRTASIQAQRNTGRNFWSHSRTAHRFCKLGRMVFMYVSSEFLGQTLMVIQASSASNDPVLHFVLFVPSLNQSPLRILNPDSTPSSSNAFLLPQWGTILLYNAEHRNTKLSLSDLEPVFKSFAAQLLTLLGAPRLPPNVARSPTETAILTDWQLDALMRRRALENAERAKDTLHSIVKLVDEIQNMPVGKDVRNDVVNALNELDEVTTNNSSSPSSSHSLLQDVCVVERFVEGHSTPFSSSACTRFTGVLQPRYASLTLLSCGTQVCRVHAALC